ncbi:glycerol-3-phosphate dehydrogenase [cyanobacterium endosymbiont of Epithemia clementina EcSB]|uniref:glycerol-3-phosphate dehydrogenase n=1 Tax=cyanobacterium endosymbiont of Epithemia clementina EcSB TaxID=3034674 RepID=UPI00248179A0|nr:glycerol-3-phosphate dehydrogenase [cyanobacterium endosymbiont of Epithemia clementina EcSB]WGT67704.1 glycerol-3-phosphate dehydrogenase [cyanobacterium endosymbiont of Epithemia clementina EcSB]
MRNFNEIQQTNYDLIVIGGGVNGAGVARDAALRGLKTILVEKGDFACGTSSWSTRLIHGGLRYLEYFEFPLVRESLKEREILLHTAPHLVKPLLLTIPIYRDRSRPYWKIWAGMILYDIFSADKTLPPHRMLPPAQFKQLFPSIDSDGLAGGAQYYDGQVTYAERLCLENIISAKEAGATVLSYVKVIHLNRQGNRITSLTCKDYWTDQEFIVNGHDKSIVINTAGPWVDYVCQSGMKDGKEAPIGKTKKIGGTKGSHIVVNPFVGAPNTSLYVEAKSDGRPFFIVPWDGMYLIGTTDQPFKGNLDQLKADDDEIDYLLRETNNIIPNARLSRKDVKFTYSGVRPLPNAEGKKPGSITRKHIFFNHSKEGVTNLISLIGGKLTTYRQVGEEMVDLVFKQQGKFVPPCPTGDKPLPGSILPGDPRVQRVLTEYRDRVSNQTMDHLFSMYGSKTLDILALIDSEPDLATVIFPELPDIKAQIVYAVRYELAYTLVDIMRRRTTLSMHSDYGIDLLPSLTETLSRYCGWDENKCRQEKERYIDYINNNCLPDFDSLKTSL